MEFASLELEILLLFLFLLLLSSVFCSCGTYWVQLQLVFLIVFFTMFFKASLSVFLVAISINSDAA